MSDAQFLATQLSVVLGEGQRPVNYPTKARSAKERATWIDFSGGSEISGMSSKHFTNFAASIIFFFGREFNRLTKASTSEEGGEGNSVEAVIARSN